MTDYTLWVGTYTQGEDRDGIFKLGFDGKGLGVQECWGGLTDPSYLQPVGERVFAVEEREDGGAVIELLSGGRSRRWELPGSGYCHITAWGDFLYASGYSGGCLAGLDMKSGKVCEYIEHSGHGPDPIRQERAHIHSAQPTPDGKGIFIADLGLDKLFQYRMGPGGRLAPHASQPWVESGPGQGPRHFAYYPGGGFLYLVTEMGQTIRAYRYDSASSTLEPGNEYPLYAGAPDPGHTAADICLSPEGRFVYASVRGSDRIFCYRTADDPCTLEAAGDFPCGGRYPRSLHISPDGRYLAAANQLSGSVAVFPRDGESGALLDMAAAADIPAAVCVKWAGR